MRLTKAQAKMLEWERVAHVATVGSGMPHLVPVCHVVVGGKIYFGSGRRGRKVRNVRANARLALTVDVYSDDWSQITGVMVQGTGRVIERDGRLLRLRKLRFQKKASPFSRLKIGAAIPITRTLPTPSRTRF